MQRCGKFYKVATGKHLDLEYMNIECPFLKVEKTE